jgi:hypothetical protein
VSLAAEPLMAAKRLRVSEATVGDVYRLAANMLPRDIAMAAKIGLDPKRALRRSFKSSPFYRRVAYFGDEILLMWGIAGDAIADVGYPWMITSTQAASHRLALLKFARHELRFMLSIRPRLIDYVAPDDVGAARLLHFFGFSPGDDGPRPMTDGKPWHQFELRR